MQLLVCAEPQQCRGHNNFCNPERRLALMKTSHENLTSWNTENKTINGLLFH